jgi:hypothetical protein
MEQIRHARVLEQGHDRTSGIVVAHPHRYSHEPIRAVVAYQVAGKDYRVSIEGDGAAPGALPSGTAVDVVYAQSDPSIARIQVLAAATPTCSWPGLAWPWIFVFGLVAAVTSEVWQTWKRRRAGNDDKAG